MLNGVLGSAAGSYPGYSYSGGMSSANKQGLVWNEASLFTWLAGPSAFLQDKLDDSNASSKMPVSFSDVQMRSD